MIKGQCGHHDRAETLDVPRSNRPSPYGDMPSLRFCAANSTIRIAFFRSLVRFNTASPQPDSRISLGPSAAWKHYPRRTHRTESPGMLPQRRVQRSYCAARIRNTMRYPTKTPLPRTNARIQQLVMPHLPTSCASGASTSLPTSCSAARAAAVFSLAQDQRFTLVAGKGEAAYRINTLSAHPASPRLFKRDQFAGARAHEDLNAGPSGWLRNSSPSTCRSRCPIAARSEKSFIERAESTAHSGEISLMRHAHALGLFQVEPPPW